MFFGRNTAPVRLAFACMGEMVRRIAPYGAIVAVVVIPALALRASWGWLRNVLESAQKVFRLFGWDG